MRSHGGDPLTPPPGATSDPSPQGLAAGRGGRHDWGALHGVAGLRLQPRLSGEEGAAHQGGESTWGQEGPRDLPGLCPPGVCVVPRHRAQKRPLCLPHPRGLKRESSPEPMLLEALSLIQTKVPCAGKGPGRAGGRLGSALGTLHSGPKSSGFSGTCACPQRF